MSLKMNHHRPISETPLKWCFAGWRFAGVSMAHHRMLSWELCDFKGIQINIARKPYVFVILLGESDTLTPPPNLDPPMACI